MLIASEVLAYCNLKLSWKNIFLYHLVIFWVPSTKLFIMSALSTAPILRLQSSTQSGLSLSPEVVLLPCGRHGCCMDSGEDMDVSFVMPHYCQLLTVLVELHLRSLHLPASECRHPLPVRPDCATGPCAVGEQLSPQSVRLLWQLSTYKVCPLLRWGASTVITMDPDTPSPS